MNLQPLYDRVILKQQEVSETTQGGIVLPTSVFSDTSVVFGKVMAVGPGYQNDKGVTIPPMIAEGDIVAFDPNDAHVLQLNGETTHMVRAHQIFAKIA